MAVFGAFILDIFDHWLFLLGILLMVEPLLDYNIAQYKKWAGKYVSRPKRTLIAVSLSLISLICACFLAFRDEYNEVAQAQQAASVSGSKIEVTNIAPVDEPVDPSAPNAKIMRFFKVTYVDKGTLDAEAPNIFPMGFLSVPDLTKRAAQEDANMAIIIKQSEAQRFQDSGNQISQGADMWVVVGIAVPDPTFKQVEAGNGSLTLGFVFKYIDSSIPKSFARYTYFCGYLVNSGLDGWNYCHTYNKVFVAKD